MFRKAEWIAAAFALLVLTWMITEGDWDLFATNGHLEGFFDAQAESLIQGRIDVPRESLSYEAFLRNGKAYGYWGLTPAFLRIPLLILFPSLKGHWSRISMLLACMVVLASMVLLFRLIEDQLPALRQKRLWAALRPVLLLAVALGSTNLFIVAEVKVYQESVAWGAALGLAHTACLGWYLVKGSGRWLALACATAFLAFSARVTSGGGPLLALALLDAELLLPWPKFREYWLPKNLPDPKRAITAITATLVISVVSWSGLNYWRFGRWLTSQPIEMNLEFTPERLANIKGEMFSVANLPFTMYSYFSPRYISFSPRFPWIWGPRISREEMVARFPFAHIDGGEPFLSLPVAAPQLLLAALAGTALVLWWKREHLKALRLAIVGAAAGSTLLFLFAYIAERYLHDMFPWFALAATAAVAWTAAAEHSPGRTAAAVFFAAATVYSIWAHFSLGLVQQGLYSIGTPVEKNMARSDLTASTLDGGIPGLISFLTHERLYIGAAAYQFGNVELDRTAIWARPNQPVLRSTGAPPYRVRYAIDIPAPGEYELAIRYASAEPRPALLLINGAPAGYVCAAATGGTKDQFQKWTFAGRHRLPRGGMTMELASENPFPAIHVYRLVRVN